MQKPDDNSWRIACEREPVIRALAQLPKLNGAAVADASQKLGVSRAWIFRLVTRYRADPVTNSLLGRPTGFPKGRHRLNPDVEAIITSEIEQFFLTRPSQKLSRLARRIKLICAERGLTPPAVRTIQSRVSEMRCDRDVTARDRKSS